MIPRNYQLEGLNEIEWLGGRALIAFDPGLGKTFLSLLYVKNHPECFPVVVVCPAPVKFVWEREAERVLDRKVQVCVIEGRGKRGFRQTKVPRMYVVNYDILRNHLEWINKTEPGLIIIDESQNLSNPSTKKTKSVQRLCRGVPNVLALSGTPFLNRPIELFPTLNILKPTVWRSRFQFGQDFCAPEWSPWGWKYKGVTNSDKLHALLVENCMVRRIKKDVLPELPDKIRSVEPIPMETPQEYEHAAADFATWLMQQDPDGAKKTLRAESMVKIGYLLRLAAWLKLKSVISWVDGWLEDAENDEKLIIFATQIKIVQKLKETYLNQCVVIDGSVTGDQRREAVEQFRENNSKRILIGNLKAAGTGVDGLQVANTVVFAELGWNPGTMLQAEDRAWRIGTKNTVFVYYLVAHGTLEEDLCRIIQERQATFNQVLNEDGEGEDLSILDELVLAMQRGKDESENDPE